MSLAVRGIPESYALNLAQISNMLILAGFVPWFIGIENYGYFSAIAALPGMIQSSFEAYCVAVLAKYQRRDVVDIVIWRVILPVSFCIATGFLLLLDPLYAVLAVVMVVLMFCRSYYFAVLITSEGLTRKIIQGEFVVTIVYSVTIGLAAMCGMDDYLLPILMVTLSSVVYVWLLMRTCKSSSKVLPRMPRVQLPQISFPFYIRSATARAYEDGFLSLAPLVLTLTSSAAVAGQFRVYVSIVKAAYKMFPYRYEIVVRDITSKRLSFRG